MLLNAPTFYIGTIPETDIEYKIMLEYRIMFETHQLNIAED